MLRFNQIQKLKSDSGSNPVQLHLNKFKVPLIWKHISISLSNLRDVHLNPLRAPEVQPCFNLIQKLQGTSFMSHLNQKLCNHSIGFLLTFIFTHFENKIRSLSPLNEEVILEWCFRIQEDKTVCQVKQYSCTCSYELHSVPKPLSMRLTWNSA